ncbi:MAG: cytochrome c3 family protein [Planctomycetaceae bacterium]
MRIVEVLLLGGLLACVPWLLVFRRRRWAAWLGAAVALVVAVGAGHVWAPPRDEIREQYQPRIVEEGGFVSSKSCKSCHPGEFHSWHRTWHRTMTQFPAPETVVGEFDGQERFFRNRRFIFERRGDEFWVTMPDPDWEERRQNEGVDLDSFGMDEVPMVERQVLLMTGSHRMQTYWVASDGDSYLVQVPWFYHVDDRRWIPADDTFLTPPDEARSFTVWNTNCIRCHTTNPIPGEDLAADHIRSRTVELGISCEACHGPAEEHIRAHSNPLGRYAARLSSGGGRASDAAGSPEEDGTSADPWHDPTIVNPAKIAHDRSTEVCGQCHSVFAAAYHFTTMRDGFSYHAGDDLWRSRKVVRFGDGADAAPEDRDKYTWLDRDAPVIDSYFWKDGTARAGGDEFNGLLESPCYQRGAMSCLSCHSMHDADPKQQIIPEMTGNRACIQCHTEYADDDVLAAHTHHSPGSAGSNCYDCHMPHTSYALYSATRSHRIDSPSVEMSKKFGRPNACNLCHLDQTLEWTGEKLTEWYGHPRPKLDDEEREVAASLLWLLRGDAGQRIIAAWHMGWEPAREASGDGWQVPFVAELLDDPYSAVRYVAEKSLRKLSAGSDLEYDFLAPPAERRASRDRAIADWNRLENPEGRTKRSEDAARVLLDPGGRVFEDRLADLLKRRDDTRVEIKE